MFYIQYSQYLGFQSVFIARFLFYILIAIIRPMRLKNTDSIYHIIYENVLADLIRGCPVVLKSCMWVGLAFILKCLPNFILFDTLDCTIDKFRELTCQIIIVLDTKAENRTNVTIYVQGRRYRGGVWGCGGGGGCNTPQ